MFITFDYHWFYWYKNFFLILYQVFFSDLLVVPRTSPAQYLRSNLRSCGLHSSALSIVSLYCFSCCYYSCYFYDSLWPNRKQEDLFNYLNQFYKPFKMQEFLYFYNANLQSNAEIVSQNFISIYLSIYLYVCVCVNF